MRSWGWSPHSGISDFVRRDTKELAHSLHPHFFPHHVRREWEGYWHVRKRALTGAGSCRYPHVWLPASRSVRKKISVVYATWSMAFCCSCPSRLRSKLFNGSYFSHTGRESPLTDSVNEHLLNACCVPCPVHCAEDPTITDLTLHPSGAHRRQTYNQTEKSTIRTLTEACIGHTFLSGTQRLG